MKITAPTTSSTLVSLLTSVQLDAIKLLKAKTTNPILRIKVDGGVLWWDNIDGVAVIGDSNSIADGDMEYIKVNGRTQKATDINDIRIIALTGVTIIITII